ncbi:hypothetical protein YC2023_090015 [Brassica napus]
MEKETCQTHIEDTVCLNYNSNKIVIFHKTNRKKKFLKDHPTGLNSRNLYDDGVDQFLSF